MGFCNVILGQVTLSPAGSHLLHCIMCVMLGLSCRTLASKSQCIDPVFEDGFEKVEVPTSDWPNYLNTKSFEIEPELFRGISTNFAFLKKQTF